MMNNKPLQLPSSHSLSGSWWTTASLAQNPQHHPHPGAQRRPRPLFHMCVAIPPAAGHSPHVKCYLIVLSPAGKLSTSRVLLGSFLVCSTFIHLINVMLMMTSKFNPHGPRLNSSNPTRKVRKLFN